MLATREDFKVSRIIATEFIEAGDLSLPDLVKVHGYWDKIRDGKVGPARQQFRLEAQPNTIIPCMAVIEFQGNPIDYYYRFFGSRMVDIAGQDLTGRWYYRDQIQGYGFVNAEIFPIMIEKRQPIVSRIRWLSARHLEVETTTVRMPLSEDGETITGGVTANSFDLVIE